MTFSMMVKDELCVLNYNSIEKRIILAEYLFLNSKYENKELIIVIENAKIARLVYTFIKELYNISINITVRTQKRFRKKQIYILRVIDKVSIVEEDVKNQLLNIEADEEKIALIKGAFLARGSITDPKKSGYHFEIGFNNIINARKVSKILKDYNFKNRIIKRKNEYMIYIKTSETISDILKLFGVTNSLFYFEDIRIYRDHKNMVNRLNNCELANQEKIVSTGLKQLEYINYIKKHDLINLLDDKTKDVINYRENYPDVSYEELANIISVECGYGITKSGINHHFIKMKELVKHHREN